MYVQTRVLKYLVSFGLLILATACSSNGGTRERLDRTTALTWTAARAPAVFARTDPRYSRAARDYVFLGPVETNARGLHEYFLWVGVGTTLDRGFLVPSADYTHGLTVTIDGEPIDLHLVPWSDLVGERSSIEPYDPPVRPLTELGARVSLDLVERIHAGAPATISVTNQDGDFRQYYAWSPMPNWSDFATEPSLVSAQADR